MRDRRYSLQVKTMSLQSELVQLELKPYIGQIVGYVLPDGRSNGQVRPAIIVNVWTDEMVNLQVFIDDSNDYPYATAPVWVTSVHYDESKSGRTWHWLNTIESPEIEV